MTKKYKHLIQSLILITILITTSLIVGEIILYFLQFKTIEQFKTPVKQHDGTPSKLCDVNTFKEAIEKGYIYGPLGSLKPNKVFGYTYNSEPHGFIDTKDFYANYSDKKRILLLGDSFLSGSSASKGQGFADLLQNHFLDQNLLFFNTGVGGYSPKHEVLVLKEYVDVVNPDLVLLAFYTGNDFAEILYPLDHITGFPEQWIHNYNLIYSNSSYSISKRTPEEIFNIYHHALGCPKSKMIQTSLKIKIRDNILKTRIGTLAWLYWHSVKFKVPVKKDDLQYWEVKKYLQEMMAITSQRNIPFYVILIPDIFQFKIKVSKSPRYLKARSLFEELSIKYIDPYDYLDINDYVGYKQDGRFDDHWNNSGHYKMFSVLKDCFAGQPNSKSLSFCLN